MEVDVQLNGTLADAERALAALANATLAGDGVDACGNWTLAAFGWMAEPLEDALVGAGGGEEAGACATLQRVFWLEGGGGGGGQWW